MHRFDVKDFLREESLVCRIPQPRPDILIPSRVPVRSWPAIWPRILNDKILALWVVVVHLPGAILEFAFAHLAES